MYDAVLREITEESGLYNFALVEYLETSYAHYYHKAKNLNRFARAEAFLLVLQSSETKPVALEDHEKFQLAWKSAEEIKTWREENNSS